MQNARVSIIKKKLYLYYNKLSFVNRIFTHLTVEEKIALHKILKNNKNEQIAVEIGSYLGASSCFIANAINKSSRLYCIDTWTNDNMINDGDDPNDINLQSQDTFSNFSSNIIKYKNKIIPIRAWSYDAINKIRDFEIKIDFLFIDGNHNYEGVKKDWDLYSPLLIRGSLVAFHDTGWAEGVNRVIKEDVLTVAEKIQELPNIQIFKIK